MGVQPRDIDCLAFWGLVGWSAWTLLGLTHKPGYAEQLFRVADHLVTLQQPDGGFHYPEFWPPYDQVEMEQKINIGAQFATWIALARTAASLSIPQP